jgi:hypothetical protein
VIGPQDHVVRLGGVADRQSLGRGTRLLQRAGHDKGDDLAAVADAVVLQHEQLVVGCGSYVAERPLGEGGASLEELRTTQQQ